MTESQIKSFLSRSEQYPQPTGQDAAIGTVRAGLAAIPFVGGSVTELMSMVFVPAVVRRRDIWFKELADDFEELQRKVEGFDFEHLLENEAFVSATIEATRIAIGSHQEEKRKYLRNALLNIAIGKGLDELKQQIFLNAIEAFTPSHVKSLDLIWRGAGQHIPWDENKISMMQRTYGTAMGLLSQELKGQPSLSSAVLAELRNRGFSSLGGPDLSFPQGGLITNLGVEFLNFVIGPEIIRTTDNI